MKITIDLKKLSEAHQEANKLALTKEADEYLTALFYLKWMTEKYIDSAKEQIAIKGNKLMPNFKGFTGTDLKGSYRQFGAKYFISDADKVDPEFVEVKVTQTVKSAVIDEYYAEHGVLPDGISESERAKKISIIEKPLIDKFESGEYTLPTDLALIEDDKN